MKRLKELYIGEWYKFGLLVIVLTAFLFMAAVTTIDLAVNVRGVLGTTNGGTGQNSTATFPASGTVMTTTTGVSATQLPNPSATTLGGVESLTCGAGSHLDSISTSGVPHCAADAASATSNQAAPTGTINGANTTFTLSPTPTAASDVNCYENGLQQQQGAGNDYTISGGTITYLTAPPTGTKLICTWY